jgi:hypothetical protein
MGGIFNLVNLHVYHYAGNNPVKYVDPDGRSLALTFSWFAVADGPLPIGDVVVGILALIDIGLLINAANEHNNENRAKADAAAHIQSNAQAAMPPPEDPNNDRKRTGHGEERYQEGRNGDPNRNVGDTNRIRTEGKHYIDSATGNNVYVKGDKVVINNQQGVEVTRFHNSQANTAARVESGKWVPVE